MKPSEIRTPPTASRWETPAEHTRFLWTWVLASLGRCLAALVWFGFFCGSVYNAFWSDEMDGLLYFLFWTAIGAGASYYWRNRKKTRKLL